MRRWMAVLVMVLSGWGGIAHASDISSSFATWQRLRDPDTVGIRFMDGARFLYDHAGWPDEKIIRLRTEAAALFERPSHEVMVKFCADFPPLSGRGMVACAQGGVGDKAKQAAWVKQGWAQGDFNAEEEERILKTYGTTLTRADHIARADSLLYEGKIAAAKRILPLTPLANQQIYAVRIAFIGGEKKAPSLLKTLSNAQQHSAGLLYDRARWRWKRGDASYAELVLAAPKDAPHADLWWPLRLAATRTAIGDRQYERALSILAHAGELEGEDLAEALWLKGWLTFRKRGDAKTAYKQFFALYTATSTPVSKARAAYWAGRTAEKNGNHDIATEWMQKAASRPTVFYGQLAQAWLKPKSTLRLPKPRSATDAEARAFEANELMRAAKMVARELDDERLRDRFIAAASAQLPSEAQQALLADLAKKLGGTATGVEAAKLALRQGVVLVPQGWPRTKLPENLAIEPALTLAITRQESQFNPTAKSSANAQGMMQLLPSTAKQVAQRMDIAFSPSMLADPATNLTLGSRYLGQLINGWDGSYILGIASYNAGVGNVRGWVKSMGNPPQNLDGAIDWVESIPFAETRNYVMRVLENLSVYRTLADDDAPLMIEKDLVR